MAQTGTSCQNLPLSLQRWLGLFGTIATRGRDELEA
jgi:hypothetical protein